MMITVIIVIFGLPLIQCDRFGFNSLPGTFVISSVNDQIKSAVGEQSVPWPGFVGFDRDPPPPLYGLTYYPWRTEENCTNITASDIESDIKLISEMAGSVYIYELYCDFGPLLVNLTRHYNMSILIGIPLNNEAEYQRQRQVLHNILTTPHLNLSHVVAISVGHMELASIITNVTLTDMVMDKLRNITEMVDLSPFPNIPVTTTDLQENILRRKLYEREQIYIGSYNTMETQKNASLAATLLYEGLFQIRNMDPAQSDDQQPTKPVILTDIGWASGGYLEPSTRDRRPNRFGNASKPTPVLVDPREQLIFLYNLHCPQYVLPPMYYIHSAFDLTWKYSANDSSAYWGLADAVTRQWKPNVRVALTWQCQGATPPLDDSHKSRGLTTWILVGICAALALIFIGMCVLVVCFWRWKRDAVRKLKRTQEQQLEYLRNCSSTSGDADSRYVKDVTKLGTRWDDYLDMLEPDYEDLSYMVAPDLRIDLSHLELREIVGEGHFGIVQRARYHKDGTSMEVAVKRLHVGARNVHQFLQEGIKMQKFNHPNVLNLIGISFTPTNMPMIITPYLDEGDVLDYIRKPENKNMPIRQLLDFCYQIAEGMRYLHELKMIHRDLAARNCMLDKELTVKIADFGLCRDISDNDSYQTTKAFELPIRWMPPEAIEKLQWTAKSDVWSYGVVMWELLSRGQQPYSDIPLIELRAYLKTGGRLARPTECPDVVYEIMKACWALRSGSRPEFGDLCESLPILLQAADRGDDLAHSDYYNAIMTMIVSRQQSIGEEVESAPQSPVSPQSQVTPKRSSGKFSRGIFTWSMPKRGAPLRIAGLSERKKSLP